MSDTARPTAPVTEYKDTLGYRMMLLRAARGMTEEQLAQKLSQRIEIEPVTEAHLFAWQKNEQLHMLADNKVLFDALKDLLIENIKPLQTSPTEKEHIVQRLDMELARALEHPKLSEWDRKIFPPAFGAGIDKLLSLSSHTNEQLLAYLNQKMSDHVNIDTPSVGIQDVIDFQTNLRRPNALESVRLKDVLGLDIAPLAPPSEKAKPATVKPEKPTAQKAAPSKPVEYTEAVLRDRFANEVRNPLYRLFQNAGRISTYHTLGTYMHTKPFVKGGPKGNAAEAAKLMEKRIARVIFPLLEMNVPQEAIKPVIARWRELQGLYMGIKAGD